MFQSILKFRFNFYIIRKVLYDFVNKNYKVRKQKKVFDKSFDPIKKIANKLIELNKNENIGNRGSGFLAQDY